MTNKFVIIFTNVIKAKKAEILISSVSFKTIEMIIAAIQCEPSHI